MKKICILGSTGSIGQNSLAVIANFPGRFSPACLTTYKNVDLLREQIRRYTPDAVAVLDESAGTELRRTANGRTKIFIGEAGLEELVSTCNVDLVINALVGIAGLRPTIATLNRGIPVALANKETLVAAGELVTTLARKCNADLIPIDSEHSAILQCLAGEQKENVARLILTASGGPFLHTSKEELPHQTIEAALQHPNWKMGNKITIDSATMMNKGLEIIEAHWLFGLPANQIEVLIHPQSIIHSMVEFVDGSVKAQLGVPDMKIPIQYALTYPDRSPSLYKRVNFAELATMTFSEPDTSKFRCLSLAYAALRAGGSAPVVLNAANEIAVTLFLNKELPFGGIAELIDTALEQIPLTTITSLDEITYVDSIARRLVTEMNTQRNRKGLYATA